MSIEINFEKMETAIKLRKMHFCIALLLSVILLSAAALALHGDGSNTPWHVYGTFHYMQKIMKDDGRTSIDSDNNGIIDEAENCNGDSVCNVNGMVVGGDLILGGAAPTYKIINLKDPTDDADAATKAYLKSVFDDICVAGYGGVCGATECKNPGYYKCDGSCFGVTNKPAGTLCHSGTGVCDAGGICLYCGDGVCNNGENCGTCISDCPCISPETCGGGGTANVCGCTISSWLPNPSTVCSGTSFTQTSNCGTTRSSVGTKVCCTPTTSCSAQSKECGSVWNGCYSEYCGDCDSGYECSNGVCVACACNWVGLGGSCYLHECGSCYNGDLYQKDNCNGCSYLGGSWFTDSACTIPAGNCFDLGCVAGCYALITPFGGLCRTCPSNHCTLGECHWGTPLPIPGTYVEYYCIEKSGPDGCPDYTDWGPSTVCPDRHDSSTCCQ